MEWQHIKANLQSIRIKFDKSYKFLSQNRNILANTVNKHAKILVDCFNEARILIHNNRGKLNQAHWSLVSKLLIKFRSNLISIQRRYNLDISIPTILNTTLFVRTSEELELIDQDDLNPVEDDNLENTEQQIKEKDHDLTIPAVINLPVVEEDEEEYWSESESNSVIEQKPAIMAQTNIEFINTASRLIPEFNGKAENLRSFIDALEIIKEIQGAHELLAVSLIKTKLKGTARNLIGTENTIDQIIKRIKDNVKGESINNLSARLLNLTQNNKTANVYTQEVEKLAKALEGAYIEQEFSMEQARMLSTKHAVTAMKKNCIHNEVRAVLRAHTFDNMDDAISAFIETSNEISEEKHYIMYYQNYAQRGRNRGRGNFRGRNYNRGGQRYYNNGGSSNYNSNKSRGGSNRGGSNRGNRRHNNNNQVRVTQGSSENTQAPLSNQS
ncbi:uncharacterized protein LOC132797895 [Drosophila nasuta]|uniref:uncharacterized protein LOC132797895 n=1 Tax=Drosophila nasuta TaxID=42062 RepID=UPI00295EA756|nr:uncharacterized protein LOC132797895 [Drosophila nasuta]